MKYDEHQFYETPTALANRMAGAIGNCNVILEPSAGNGALIDAYKKVQRIRNSRGAQFLVCEIDSQRRTKLAIDGHRIIGEDFLQSRVSQYYYDGVIMNPPFRNGLKHVRHAWENLAPGGKMVALINADQVTNSSKADFAFYTELTNAGMELENIDGAFSDADRPTDVRCALMVATKPARAKQGDDYDDIWKTLQDERVKAAGGDIKRQEEGLVAYDIVVDIVAQYNASLNYHSTVIEAHKNMQKFLPVSIKPEILKMPSAFDSFEKELRDNCWTRIFRETGISDIMTTSIRREFQKFCETQKRIEFTVKNIENLCANLAGDLNRIRSRAVRELFVKFTSYHEDNAYSGWKTNSSWRVGNKIILPNWFERDWGGRTVSLRYHYQGDANDIEKTLCLMTGKKLADVTARWTSDCRYVRSSLHVLGNKVETGVWHDSEFFEWKCWKKGTVHLKWKDPQLQKDFNELASRGNEAVGFGR